MNFSSGFWVRGVFSAFALSAFVAGTAAAQVATENRSPGGISWDIHVSYGSVQLTVGGASGEVFRQSYANDPSYELVDNDGYFLADGQYNYELRMFPYVSEGTLQQLQLLRDSGDESALNEMLDALGLNDPETYSGGFTIFNGSLTTGLAEPQPDVVYVDDLIIQGSGCFGFDCSNGMAFGFDTIRLRENNLRIHFDDSSNSGSFPANDWRLTANGSNNGDPNFFALEDATAGRQVFRVDAGAISNALYVDSAGDVGIGTNMPAVELHAVDGNTPALRLHQDGSNGFTPQVWDVAGNETNFFIRDVTNGSELPFKIIPGATDNVLVLKNEYVGVGTTNPKFDIHIQRNRNTQIELESTHNASHWRLQNWGGNFRITKTGTGQSEMTLAPSGDLTIAGSLSEGSSHTIKDVHSQVDGASVLDKLTELPISEWSYKTSGDVRHLGPMAEDFYRLFGLGRDAEHLAARDLAAVSVAAVQELRKKLDEKDEAIAALEERLRKLEAAVAEPR